MAQIEFRTDVLYGCECVWIETILAQILNMICFVPNFRIFSLFYTRLDYSPSPPTPRRRHTCATHTNCRRTLEHSCINFVVCFFDLFHFFFLWSLSIRFVFVNDFSFRFLFSQRFLRKFLLEFSGSHTHTLCPRLFCLFSSIPSLLFMLHGSLLSLISHFMETTFFSL